MRRPTCWIPVVALGAALAGPPAGAFAGPAADKSGYNLFRPTPSTLLRDLSTDRPDLTESPYTVDAGHVQAEIEVASLARDTNAEKRAEHVGFLNLNAKLGLLPSVDLQVGAGGARSHTTDEIAKETSTGVTDLAVRLKWNLWGNDAGGTALALMPFVTFPTGSGGLSSDAVEGGLIVPLAISLPAETGMGLMVEADVTADGDGSGRHVEWFTTATVSHDLVGALAGFVEFAALQRPRAEGEWVGTVDVGVTYAATPNVQLDGGILMGVSEDADGAAYFLGVTVRR
jgi:hypothetical protein